MAFWPGFLSTRLQPGSQITNFTLILLGFKQKAPALVVTSVPFFSRIRQLSPMPAGWAPAAARKFSDRRQDIHLKHMSEASIRGQRVEIGRALLTSNPSLRPSAK